MTVTIVDAENQQVATIASDESVGAHAPQHFVWDGRTADGTLAPDGVYHPWVHLSHARWTGRFTNNITLDTTPPKVLSPTGGKPDHVFFAGPGRTVAIKYTFSKKAHALVYLGRRQIIARPHDRDRRTRSSGRGRSAAGRFPRGRTSSRSVRRTSPATRPPPRSARPSRSTVRYVELTPERDRGP